MHSRAVFLGAITFAVGKMALALLEQLHSCKYSQFAHLNPCDYPYRTHPMIARDKTCTVCVGGGCNCHNLTPLQPSTRNWEALAKVAGLCNRATFRDNQDHLRILDRYSNYNVTSRPHSQSISGNDTLVISRSHSQSILGMSSRV